MDNKNIKYCPVCQQNNEITELRLYQISCTKATYFCQKLGCVYPVGYGWTFVDRPFEELAGSQSESEESEDLSSDEEIIRPVFSTINILDHDLEYSIKLFEKSDNGFIKIKKQKKIEDKKIVNVKTISDDKLDSALDFLEDINFSEENIKPIEQNNHKSNFEIQRNKTFNSFIEDQRTDPDINDDYANDFLNSLIGQTENNCNENPLNVSFPDFDMFDINDSIDKIAKDSIIVSNENINQQNSQESSLTKENNGENAFLENNLSNKVVIEDDEQLVCTENKVDNKPNETISSCLAEKDNYNVEEMELIDTEHDTICTNKTVIESADTIKNMSPVLPPYKINNRTSVNQEVKINSDIQILDIVNIPIIFEDSPEAKNILNVKIIDSTYSESEIDNSNFSNIEYETTFCNSAENIGISKTFDNVDNIENDETNKVNDLTVKKTENTSDNCDAITEALLNASVNTLKSRNKDSSLETMAHDAKNETVFDSKIINNDNKTAEPKLQTLELAAPLSNEKHNLKCFKLKDIKEKGMLYCQDLKKIDKFADNSACYIISNPNEIPKELANAKVIPITRLRKMPPIMLALDSGPKIKRKCPKLTRCSMKKPTKQLKTKVSDAKMKLDLKEVEMNFTFDSFDESQSTDMDELYSSSAVSETDEEAPKNLKNRKTHKNLNLNFKRAKAVKFDNFNADMKKNIDFLKSLSWNKNK